MKISFENPANYDYGIIHTKIELSDEDDQLLQKYPLKFEIPELDQGVWNIEAGHRVFNEKQSEGMHFFRGAFNGAIWTGDFIVKRRCFEEMDTIKDEIRSGLTSSVETILSEIQ